MACGAWVGRSVMHWIAALVLCCLGRVLVGIWGVGYVNHPAESACGAANASLWWHVCGSLIVCAAVPH